MAYYIRRKNEVYRGSDLVLGPCWTDITPTTKYVIAAIFTTRKDATDVLQLINDDSAVISNDLEYYNE